MPDFRPVTDEECPYIAPDIRALAVPIVFPLEDPENARAHPVRNVEAIAASIRRFGQRTPIVVNRRTRYVEKGNGTLAAMLSEGYRYIAAVLVDEDPATSTAYAVTDNRTSDLSEWNIPHLRRALLTMQEFGYPLRELGWSDAERDTVLRGLPKWDEVLGAPKLRPEDASGPTCEGALLFPAGEHIFPALKAVRSCLEAHPELEGVIVW